MNCCTTPDDVKTLIEDKDCTNKLALLFKAFSEPIRIEILLAMLHNEICVNDLSILLNASQPRISNQLRFLKQNNLIKSRKEKNNIFYSLNDEHIQIILNIGIEHINHL